jgi:hypothetical protein
MSDISAYLDPGFKPGSTDPNKSWGPVPNCSAAVDSLFRHVPVDTYVRNKAWVTITHKHEKPSGKFEWSIDKKNFFASKRNDLTRPHKYNLRYIIF